MADNILENESLPEIQGCMQSAALAGSTEQAIKIARAAVKRRLDAAELPTTNKDQKKNLILQAEVLLTDVASIQRNPNWPGKAPLPGTLHRRITEEPKVGAQGIKGLKEPVSSRVLPKREEIILLKASKINGCTFPPWKGPPAAREFELVDGEEPYTDPHELCLTPHQMEFFDGWKRAKDAIPPPAWNAPGLPRLGPLMKPLHKDVDLVQDAVSDCSVVASLCAASARGKKGHRKLGGSIIFPYDAEGMSPKMSPNGKYVVRLNFNGCYRKVTIDDRLPVSKTKRVLHVLDRRNPTLLWPALVEKAYLKVRGGYDFPGSNSGTDLWILSGWIPEQIFLHSDDTIPSRLWDRVTKAFGFGDVMVTLGTGTMSHKAERELGLAGLHDYAVLDLKEEDAQKLLLVKNPWCEGPSWRGSITRPPLKEPPKTGLEETDRLMAIAKGMIEPKEGDIPEKLAPGTFWIDFNNVLQHFETMYLNWNPGLFEHRQDMHFSWDLTHSRTGGKTATLIYNPQVVLSSELGGSVWVLLCRHFKGSVTGPPTPEIVTGYIALHAYDTRGQRVYFDDNPLERGRYIDSPQTLLKLSMPPHTKYTLVVAGEELDHSLHTFTFSTFSSKPLTLEGPSDKYSGCYEVRERWTTNTAGGNSHSSTYSRNPQYKLTLPTPGPISLLLQTPNPALNVNIKLLYGRGKRVTSLNRQDIIADSGDYRRGAAQAAMDELPAGTYTIVVSTFEAGQTGDYTLRIDAATQPELELLPREGAGRLEARLSRVLFAPGVTKMTTPMHPARHVRFNIVSRFLGTTSHSIPATRSPIRLSLELGKGPDRRFLIASERGEFSDREVVRTEDVDVEPRMGRELWLVIERMNASEATEEFEVCLWLEGAVGGSVEVGGWRADG